jgi:hypothetical protein
MAGICSSCCKWTVNSGGWGAAAHLSDGGGAAGRAAAPRGTLVKARPLQKRSALTANHASPWVDTLGRVDELAQDGTLDRLLRSGATAYRKVAARHPPDL